jgi:hypothetical protein
MAVKFGWFIDATVQFPQIRDDLLNISDAGHDLVVSYLSDPRIPGASGDSAATQQIENVLNNMPVGSSLQMLLQMPDGHWQPGTLIPGQQTGSTFQFTDMMPNGGVKFYRMV